MSYSQIRARLLQRPSLTFALLSAGALAAAAYFALPAGSFEQSVFYSVIGIGFVVASAAVIARRRPPGSLGWLLMVLGQLAFVIGDLIWTIFSFWGEDPFPSVADIAYLAGYPLIALGLAVAIRRRVAGGDRASLLDGAILATGAGIIWWVVALMPAAATADSEPMAFAISVAYPLGDLLLIGMALALAVTPGSRGASFALLIGSLVVMLVGDLVFALQTAEGTYVDGSWLDAAWIASYVLFAASTAHRTMASLVEPQPVPVVRIGVVRLTLLGSAMLIGPGLLLVEHSTSDAVIVVVAAASAALSVLVLARLAVVVRHLDSDIERRKALEAQLAFQAFHDPLTGLANRRRFMSAVSEAISASTTAAVMFVDLDDFKDVNDQRGHEVGDALLAAVGERLRAVVRAGDLVGRLGGDEFAVLMPTVESAQVAEMIAGRVVEAFAQPIRMDGRAVTVSASVGLMVRKPTDRQGVDEFLRQADVAMYHAKARGKNRWATFTPDMEAEAQRSPLVRRPAPAA
jgi:diguanylate cyclase (GGDEF)-like protein